MEGVNFMLLVRFFNDFEIPNNRNKNFDKLEIAKLYFKN